MNPPDSPTAIPSPLVGSSSAAAQAAAIELHRVGLKLKSLEIIRDLSVSFPAGQITALLGPSGCGKSTLLKMIAGLLKPTTGEVRFASDAVNSSTLPVGQLSYVFQDASLMPWRTTFKNIALPLEVIPRTHSNSVNEVVQTQLANVALDEVHWNKFPHELSGGMKMRVSIARALVTDPQVLLLDEPFSALDDILRRRLGELVVDLWKQRPRTIVLVTHNIDEAILLSQRIVVMGAGRIAQEIPVDLQFTPGVDSRRTPEFVAMYGVVADALREAAS